MYSTGCCELTCGFLIQARMNPSRFLKLVVGLSVLMGLPAMLLMSRRLTESSSAIAAQQELDLLRNSLSLKSSPMAEFRIGPRRLTEVQTGSDESEVIPKIIHQMWKSLNIPKTFLPWMESILRLNDDWQYWLWTDGDMEEFMTSVYPEYLELYRSYPGQIYRAEVFRYFVLYKYGGVYADLDMECLKPFDTVTEKYSCVVNQQPLEHTHFLRYTSGPEVCNSLMACHAGHPFFELIIRSLNSTRSKDRFEATGPKMLTDAYNQYLQNSSHYHVTLAPSEMFNPRIDEGEIERMRKNCSADTVLPASLNATIHAILCNKITKLDFGSTVNPSTISDHHWTRSYSKEFADSLDITDTNITFEADRLREVQRPPPTRGQHRLRVA